MRLYKSPRPIIIDTDYRGLIFFYVHDVYTRPIISDSFLEENDVDSLSDVYIAVTRDPISTTGLKNVK